MLCSQCHKADAGRALIYVHLSICIEMSTILLNPQLPDLATGLRGAIRERELS
jgi:hypothetical protein